MNVLINFISLILPSSFISTPKLGMIFKNETRNAPFPILKKRKEIRNAQFLVSKY